MKKNFFGVSLITLTCLYGMLSIVVILFCYFLKVPIIYGIGISIIILILQFIFSPLLTDLSMKFLYKVSYNYNFPDYVNNFIDELCRKHNMKRPKIGFIDDGAPNAFTYGWTKNTSRVIISRGVFELLNENEVLAVISHEFGHATHYDMLVMTVAQLVPLVLYAIAYSSDDNDNNSNNNDNNGGIIQLIALILYFISQYIVLWLSRTREYYADSFAVEETKNPNALAEALIKIGYGLNNSNSKKNNKNEKRHSVSNSNALGIFDSKTSKTLIISSYKNGEISKDSIKNAMKWECWNIWAKFYELNSTHPLISKRINAISKRCSEFNQEPYIEFDLKKPESYIDDFAAELFIKYLPFLIIIITFMLIILDFGDTKMILGIGGIVAVLFSFLKLSFRNKNKNYINTNVLNLLSEVKVSGVTCIPCIVKGKIIGRGNPGYILNEDFVIQDDTGIMFLDYNQPIAFVNKLFAIFKSKEYFEKEVTIKGWYRRNPVPYIEIYTMEVDGVVKNCYTYLYSLILRFILLIIFILILIFSFI